MLHKAGLCSRHIWDDSVQGGAIVHLDLAFLILLWQLENWQNWQGAYLVGQHG